MSQKYFVFYQIIVLLLWLRFARNLFCNNIHVQDAISIKVWFAWHGYCVVQVVKLWEKKSVTNWGLLFLSTWKRASDSQILIILHSWMREKVSNLCTLALVTVWLARCLGQWHPLGIVIMCLSFDIKMVISRVERPDVLIGNLLGFMLIFSIENIWLNLLFWQHHKCVSQNT